MKLSFTRALIALVVSDLCYNICPVAEAATAASSSRTAHPTLETRAKRNRNLSEKARLLDIKRLSSTDIRKVDHSMEKKKSWLLASEPKTTPWYFGVLPIYPSELAKYFSLSLMMFWIVFVFTMTRDTKDALIVTNCGAEAIAFLKVYGVVPAAGLFMVGYSKMANIFDSRTLFYATLLPFFIFYTLFAFVIYPLRNVIHPMSIEVPTGGLSFAVNLFRHWSFSLYYIVSELWGSAGIPLLFWSCANEVVKIDQAKRIYPYISLIGNLGPILSGMTMTYVSKFVSSLYGNNEEQSFEISLKVLTGLMVGAGFVTAGLHWNIQRLTDRERAAEKEKGKSQNDHATTTAAAGATATAVEPKKSKPKLSFGESLRVLASNRYLRNVATMVLSYGLTIEFTEIIWKASVKRAFPVKTDYLRFQGQYSTIVGVLAFVMMFVGSNIVKWLGWRAGALLTPSLMGLLALPFYAAIISSNSTQSQKALLFAVYVGLAQNAVSKATKYAVFDPTKEMTYIPLDHDSKTKGKAAIDVLGARLGKSGGALAQQLLVLVTGNIMTGAPVVATLFYVGIAMWIAAVNDLAPRFERASKEMDAATLAVAGKKTN